MTEQERDRRDALLRAFRDDAGGLPVGYRTHGDLLELARADAYGDWCAWKNDWAPDGEQAITHLRTRVVRGALIEDYWAARYLRAYAAAWEEFSDPPDAVERDAP